MSPGRRTRGLVRPPARGPAPRPPPARPGPCPSGVRGLGAVRFRPRSVSCTQSGRPCGAGLPWTAAARSAVRRRLFGTFAGSSRSGALLGAPVLPAHVLGACPEPAAIRPTFTSVPVALCPWNRPAPHPPCTSPSHTHTHRHTAV